MMKVSIVIVSVLCGLFLLCAIVFHFTFIGSDVAYETFSVSVGKRLEILRPTVAEPVYGFCYRVFDADRETVPTCYFESHSKIPQRPYYQLISDPSSNFVGIVSYAEPEIILVMHNFNMRESWPFPGGMNYERGRVMLGRLQALTGRTNLFLTGTSEASDWVRLSAASHK